jgi:hypothetical protein
MRDQDLKPMIGGVIQYEHKAIAGRRVSESVNVWERKGHF